MPALEGEQILTVRAKNKNGTESVVTRKFVSDSKGPTITEARPKDGDLVGNVVTIQAEVKDPAGVLASSVVAVFANGPGTEYTIPLNPPAPGATPQAYSAIFDTRLLPFGENALFPTLSFRASDNLGNESLLTNVVWLDNRPPLAELDPPEMRMLAKQRGQRLRLQLAVRPGGTGRRRRPGHRAPDRRRPGARRGQGQRPAERHARTTSPSPAWTSPSC